MIQIKRNFLFFPRPIDAAFEPALADGVELTMVNGLGDTKLAVYHRAEPDPGLPFVLYSHGACSIVEFEHAFFKRAAPHMNLVAYDYRGYGRSEGKPSEYAADFDLLFLLKWIHERYSVPVEDIVLFGRSLGTNFVMRFIGNPQRQAVLPRRVILYTPFLRYNDVLRRLQFPAPFLAHAVGNMDVTSAVATYCDANRDRRVLVMGVNHDAITPYEHALEIRETAPDQVQLVTLIGNHSDSFEEWECFDDFMRLTEKPTNADISSEDLMDCLGSLRTDEHNTESTSDTDCSHSDTSEEGSPPMATQTIDE